MLTPSRTSVTAAFPSAWVKAAGIGTVTFKDWLMRYRILNHIAFKAVCDISLLPPGLQEKWDRE